ncbi:MAG: CRISPR-associated endonuclease Cas2 [Clostridia bacterium]
MYVILIYDIVSDETGAKVTRNIFKTAKKYLFHIQNSVFEGEIDEVRLTKLKRELSAHIRKTDSCIIFKSRSKKWLDKEFLTNIEDKTSNIL